MTNRLHYQVAPKNSHQTTTAIAKQTSTSAFQTLFPTQPRTKPRLRAKNSSPTMTVSLTMM